MNRATLAFLAIAPLWLFASFGVRAQTQLQPLEFFKSHILTGDYVVGGVGLSATGQGQIAMSGVPTGGTGVDVVAAYLYWQVVVGGNANPEVGATGVTFRGYPLDGVQGVFGKVLGAGSPTCSAGGGGTGASNGSKITYTYRADVLRYLDVDAAAPTGTGKTLVNGLHSVSVPVTNQLQPLGASLVVVYRNPSLPLSAVVLYDGGFTMNQETEGMALALEGFYQAGTAGKLSYIAGSGQANKSERLSFDGAEVAVNAFAGGLGAAWDNPTFPVTVPAGAARVTTSVDNIGFSSFDCLNFAAVVFRTTVQDTDDDGLIDAWESATSAAPLRDPAGTALPALGDMGASPLQKDLFIEVGYLKTDAPTAYGGVTAPAHSHLPPPAALKLMGDTLAQAPGSQAIRVHFDVGPDYQDPTGEASAYVIRGAGLARGGEAIDESVTVCTPGPNASPWDCQFSAYPGTVGWKSGFRFLRDDVVVDPPAGVDCDLPGAACERRFDRNRHQMFHYALFAHAVGLPASELPCLDAGGQPTEEDPATDRCTTGVVNPQFRIPRTNTGVGDFPGGDILVTLGAFPDVSGLPVGTPFMQASTLLHEFGHNAERRHGGDVFEPNCKPAYPSAMNYLYQLRGLLDDDGTPHLGFSDGQLGLAIDEGALADGATSTAPYRLGWYAPLAGSYLAGRARPAARHCDGTPVLSTEAAFVRIDARTAAGAIDWNANSAFDAGTYALDVNFNGRANPALGDSNDWGQLRLNQIGVRRNVGTLVPIPGTSLFAVAPLSLDAGKGDLGKGDLGKGDLGKGDLGKGDLGKGDLGKGDLGKGDLGKGDLGKGDLGGGDLFTGDPNNPGGELDFATAGDLAKTPPNQFRACVIGSDPGCTGTAAQLHRVRLAWTAPNVGGVASFAVYRVDGAGLTPGQTWTPVGAGVPAVLGSVHYTAVDETPLVNGAEYTYFAVATYADDVASDASNLRTIVGVNDPPNAADDDYTTNEDTALTVPAPGVLGNDTDADSPGAAIGQAVVDSNPQHGTLSLQADGSFVYTPAANYHGPDAFTYRASDGTTPTNTATVRITVSAVNDAPTATGDSYAVNEDTPLVIPAPGVLGNDGDADSDPLAAVVVATPTHGTLALDATGGFTYTPAADYNGPDSFTYRASDGTLASPTVTVALTVTAVNDTPSISNIADVTVAVNGSTGALAFTIGDVDGVTGLTVSGSSSNTTLVPATGIVFGGSGATRTVTVTPALNQIGTSTITVTVRDAAGLTASDTFVVTVKSYTFVGLQNIPPPAGKSFKAGSSIPLSWQYKDGATVVDSSQARFQVTAVGPLPNPTINNTDSGQSSFRYSSGSWNFNMQTKDAAGKAYPLGTYQVTVTSLTPGFPSSPTFLVTLVK